MELLKFLKLKENSKPSVSIDFGASFIKIACVENAENTYRLLSYALIKLEANQNTVEQISQSLKQLLESKAITEKEVALTISDPDWIFIKKLSLPQMPKHELLNAVKWQLKGQFSFNPDESVADLQIIREYTDNESAKKVELFCIFAKKDLIDKYVAVAVACGLSPVKVSSSVFNYCGTLNLLSANPEISAILDIGQVHSQVSIYQKNKIVFSRNLHFSTEKLTALLIGVLVTENGKFQIDMQKAQEFLGKFGIPLNADQILEEGIKPSQIISLLRPFLETVTKELNRSFEYFKAESGLDIPTVLYITGEGANLRNFDGYLAQELEMRVEKLPLADLLDTKNVDKAKLDFDAAEFSSVIGLSLSKQGINLLPLEIKNRKLELIQNTSLRIAAISLGALFIFSWFITNFQISDYKKRLKIARAHLQNIQGVKNLKLLVDSRQTLIDTIQFGKIPVGGLLKLISAIIPPSIILDDLVFDQSSHALRLSGVVTAGKDSVEKTLTDFMKELEDSKFIDDANLISSKEDQGINYFEIKCDLAK